MSVNKAFNVPNLLSAYRLAVLPVIIWTLVTLNKDLFVLLLCINLITDILDGLIARLFKLETELGARLDSIADIGTIVMAVLGMIKFAPGFMREHVLAFGLMLSLYLAFELTCLIKFGRFPSMHLYSAKIVGYIQGIFIFTFFVYGHTPWYFYFMIVASCLAYAEELSIAIVSSKLRSNCKGLYWVLKEQNNLK